MSRREISLLEVVLGLWIVATPYVFGFDGNTTALFTSIILGAAIAVVGYLDVTLRVRYLPWANVVLGAVLIISPFVLLFSELTAAVASSVIVGALVALNALISELRFEALERREERPERMRRAA